MLECLECYSYTVHTLRSNSKANEHENGSDTVVNNRIQENFGAMKHNYLMETHHTLSNSRCH